jgi:ankyrin repeat protein
VATARRRALLATVGAVLVLMAGFGYAHRATPDAEGNSALISAISAGNADLAQALLEQPDAVNLPNRLASRRRVRRRHVGHYGEVSRFLSLTARFTISGVMYVCAPHLRLGDTRAHKVPDAGGGSVSLPDADDSSSHAAHPSGQYRVARRWRRGCPAWW